MSSIGKLNMNIACEVSTYGRGLPEASCALFLILFTPGEHSLKRLIV